MQFENRKQWSSKDRTDQEDRYKTVQSTVERGRPNTGALLLCAAEQGSPRRAKISGEHQAVRNHSDWSTLLGETLGDESEIALYANLQSSEAGSETSRSAQQLYRIMIVRTCT